MPITSRPIQPAPPRIVILAAEPFLRERAAALGRQLDLPVYRDTAPADADLALLVDDHGLGLIIPGDRMTPVRVDFTGGRMRYRRRAGGQEALVRAMGSSGGRTPRIFDATAGLGRDAFILACRGYTVHLAERNPVLAAMLADGIARLRVTPDGKEIADRLVLHQGDSIDLLADPARRHYFDCIYLDPLFPERNKTALVKKEMRVVRLLTETDNAPDDDRLLAAALANARSRVVVKRPRLAPFLAHRRPHHQITGRSSRFDIYLVG